MNNEFIFQPVYHGEDTGLQADIYGNEKPIIAKSKLCKIKQLDFETLMHDKENLERWTK